MSCLMLHMGFLTERPAETTGKRNPGLETESAERTGQVPPVSGGTWKYSGSASQPNQTAATWPGGILQPEPGIAGMKQTEHWTKLCCLLTVMLKITFLLTWHDISKRTLFISIRDAVLIQSKTAHNWKCLSGQSLSFYRSVLFHFDLEIGKCGFLAGFGTLTSAQYNLIYGPGGYGPPAIYHCYSLLKFQNPEWVFRLNRPSWKTAGTWLQIWG